ncbi:ABC transporter ATP-binding protein [Bogoriella caseilytica]|nr:ABC transporter ATP-binding protein [Bogoriella caseilytica]
MPRRAWLGVALSWLRTLSLAVVFLAVGAAVDVVGLGYRQGSLGLSTPLLAAEVAAALAVACTAWAAAEPPRLQGAEEQSWRARGIRSALSRDAAPGRATGGEVYQLTRAVEAVAAYRAEFIGPSLAAFTAPTLVLVVVAIAVDPLIAGLLTALVVLVPVVSGFFIRLFRARNARYRRLSAQASARFAEMLRTLGSLVLMGASDRGRAVVAQAAADLRQEAVALLRRSQLVILVNDALFSLVMVTAAAVLALWRLDAGALSGGAALSVVLLATLLNEPIDKLGRSFYIGLGGRAQQSGLQRLVAGAPARIPVPARPADTADLTVRGLAVTRGGSTVLRDVDLHLPAGSVLAVVGPSGAGKSSFAAAMAGLLPAEGEIELDGAPAGRAELQAASVLVAQSPFLVSGTIAENLRLAKPEATTDELWDALRLARLEAEVAAMPSGLDTAVGESGSALSGGQVRRVAIARAVLSGAPLLVLDEPTADLDRHTENLVTEMLQELAGQRTLILIAHRLATTAWADQVLVLEEGRAVALGTPQELTEGEGYYAVATDGEGEW